MKGDRKSTVSTTQEEKKKQNKEDGVELIFGRMPPIQVVLELLLRLCPPPNPPTR